VTGWWFSPGTPVSFPNKTDHHDKTDIVESGVKHHNPKIIHKCTFYFAVFIEVVLKVVKTL